MNKRTDSIFPFLLIMLLLVPVGCKTVVESTDTNRYSSDSVKVKETVRVDTVFLPGATTQVRVPVEVLKTDTVIVTRNKHATQSIHVENGQVTATADCDSLEKLVLNYEREIERISSQKEDNNMVRHEEKRGYRFWVITTLLLMGAAVVFTLLLTSKFKL